MEPGSALITRSPVGQCLAPRLCHLKDVPQHDLLRRCIAISGLRFGVSRVSRKRGINLQDIRPPGRGSRPRRDIRRHSRGIRLSPGIRSHRRDTRHRRGIRLLRYIVLHNSSDLLPVCLRHALTAAASVARACLEGVAPEAEEAAADGADQTPALARCQALRFNLCSRTLICDGTWEQK